MSRVADVRTAAYPRLLERLPWAVCRVRLVARGTDSVAVYESCVLHALARGGLEHFVNEDRRG